ncbi:MAG: hypothetical protein LBE78_05360 [Burkholderiaceae bacterium]|jgi:hypothetical protein|nr:hypothetical protein [Burkholderiaceae bacterium]
MKLRDDEILYSLDVSDIRSVAEQEGFRELGDDEIRRVGDRMGDYLNWYEAIILAIKEVK